MNKKGKMPPELLAHFKKKAGNEDDDKSMSPKEKENVNKEKRRDAVKKARVRLEEKKRGDKLDEEEKAGQKRA